MVWAREDRLYDMETLLISEVSPCALLHNNDHRTAAFEHCIAPCTIDVCTCSVSLVLVRAGKGMYSTPTPSEAPLIHIGGIYATVDRHTERGYFGNTVDAEGMESNVEGKLDRRSLCGGFVISASRLLYNQAKNTWTLGYFESERLINNIEEHCADYVLSQCSAVYPSLKVCTSTLYLIRRCRSLFITVKLQAEQKRGHTSTSTNTATLSGLSACGAAGVSMLFL